MSLRQSFGFPLSVDVGSDVGRIRDNNEDSFGSAWLEDGSLFVIVADGMGGHEAGEVASSLAVRVVEDVVREDPDADPRDRLYNALLEANQAILEEGASSGTRGMGTTAICAIVKGNQAYIGQVGDSRCYQFRRGHKVWRSTDHTRVQMLVDEGRLSEEQARHHPEAGMLTRALGHARMADGQPLVPQVLDQPVVLEPGDSLLFCSDGLHDLLEDEEIARAAAGKAGPDAIKSLIAMACDRGGHDNITIALVNTTAKVGDFDPRFVPPAASRPAYAEGRADDEHATFDMGHPPPTMAPGAMPSGHLHAPTVAPDIDLDDDDVPPPPRPAPRPAPAPAVKPASSPRPAPAAPPDLDDDVAPKKSNMPLILGIVAAVVLLLVGVLGCGGAIAAWVLLGTSV
jgi:protein phosphatase